jgi:hypothetical protein
MTFYRLELQMPSCSLQTKTGIHCKQKWIIEISPKLQTSNEKQNKTKKLNACEMKDMENVIETRMGLGFI